MGQELWRAGGGRRSWIQGRWFPLAVTGTHFCSRDRAQGGLTVAGALGLLATCVGEGARKDTFLWCDYCLNRAEIRLVRWGRC